MEKSIIFSGEMVNAILDGRKTMTRRVIKILPSDDSFILVNYRDGDDGWWPYGSDDGESSVKNDGNEKPYSCPFGKVGDRLWVRESFRQMQHGFDYKADHEYRIGFTWKPSIHMPRIASRITLEITEIRVERLQDISEADAKAEGLMEWKAEGLQAVYRYGMSIPDVWEKDPRQAFARLWEKINGKKHPWAENPFVWVIGFKQIEENKNERNG